MIRSFTYLIAFGLSLFLLFSCDQTSEAISHTQFSKLESERSGVDFSNSLKFDQSFNIYKYRNYYNGGGVGIGDVNNDGFVDIYFTGNLTENRLYLNNGDLTFTDVTESAGVGGKKSWSTGVSMADINGDNLLDIYVCNSGNIKGDNKQNELFINNGDGTFIESAEAYGLADKGFSTHAAFFDYDRDGDLDVYLLNNSFQAIGSFNLKKNQRPVRNEDGGDKLFRNDNGRFIDISEEAGIYGSVIGFGLGVTVGDLNLDGWQDIFISNDFFERDYIYINNQDGTFSEELENQMKSITGASMGADMADINNDGYPDLFVTEMLPEPNDRLKTKTTFENWDRYQYNVDNGYYHQFTRNMLHLNNGDNTFSEIGRLAGVEATDWSWGALIADYDNDGNKDLFIANGIYKDLTDQDYINYISTAEMAKSVISEDGVDFQKLTDVIPSNQISNYMYRNQGELEFNNVTRNWGLDEPSHSNGSAYADLDNDGDLDLVINNLNATSSIYINYNERVNPDQNYIKLVLKGGEKNTSAVGSRVQVYQGEQMYAYEQMPVKGFQSSVDPRINIGLNKNDIDSLIVFWPNGDHSKLNNVSVNQTLVIDYNETDRSSNNWQKDNDNNLFEEATGILSNYTHIENEFVDFDRDRLLYHMLSVEGPALCKGDFNSDGLEDIYIGGAKDQEASMFFQSANGSFRKVNNSLFAQDKLSEDVDCSCFDADNDGDLDLYVASGGNEFPSSSSALIDRLYFNDGKGSFTKSNQILPTFQFENTSVVAPSDFDNDGDLDLFVGTRAKPFLLGIPVDGYLLENDGSGEYRNVTTSSASVLKKLGMITDATWADIDQDGSEDLIVVGEWMGIKVFKNDNGILIDISSEMGVDSTNGWWNTIAKADVDNDGDIDFVIGNHGLNSRFKASLEKPVTMYVNDFDQNGSAEPIVCTYIGEKSYPLALKHDLVMQLPVLKKKYVAYESYKDQSIEDIFGPELIEKSVTSEVYMLESVALINEGDSFDIKALPRQAQLSPVYGIEIQDFDRDGHLDVVLGGNFYNAKPEVGRYDASYGTFLKGDGTGDFSYITNESVGLSIDGQVRALTTIKSNQENLLLIARNNESLLTLKY